MLAHEVETFWSMVTTSERCPSWCHQWCLCKTCLLLNYGCSLH